MKKVMKKKLLLNIIALFVFSFYGFSQEEKEEMAILNHKVELGETVMMIAKKYVIKPQEIYDINPDAVEGIHQHMVLKIPVDKMKAKLKPEQQTKVVTELVTVRKKEE
jgi:hypothetical protein